jgi:hypothetical protein
MSVCITVHIVDQGEIKVSHQFWGETEEEAEDYLDHHKESCSYFRSNYESGNVIEEVDDEVERPEPEDFDDDEEDED